MGDDCDALLQNIADLLHGELDAHQAAHLRDHLDDCPPCFETADFQAHLRRIVATRCGEEVPTDFRARVAAMLQVELRRRDSSGVPPSP
jgi:anti-sigma factor (TIGR02949 family)